METSSRYEIIDTLATGDFAVVYRARDRELGREVAIKQIHQQFLDDPRQLERYWREAQILASLQHPNVLTVYDIERSRGWLIVELMRGNLQQMIATGPIDLDFLRFGLVCSLNALTFLHANGIIHGDIKPSNLLIDSQNRVKIGDFGLARRASNEQGSLLKGTTKYMAPELAGNQFGPVGPASDLYSLGFSAYELMCGPRFEQLFPGLATFGPDRQIAWLMWHAAADRNLPEISRVLEGVPPDLARVIQKLSAKDPAQRYSTAKDALRDLRSRGAATLPAQQTPAEPPPPKGKKLVRLGAIAALACSLILCVWMLMPPAAPVTPQQDSRAAAGVVESVYPEERRLVIRTPEDKPLDVTLHPRDEFYINGKQSLLRDLMKSDRVDLEWLKDEKGNRFQVVRATRPERLDGRIKAMDVESGKFTLAHGEPERQLEIRVPHTAKLALNGQDKLLGKPVELKDLKAGDRVAVDHVGEEDGRAATSAAAQRDVVLEGILRDVDLRKNQVTIEAAGGTLVPLPLAPNCEVTINDRKVLDQRKVGPADLKPGDRVRATHNVRILRVDAYRKLGQVGVVRAVHPNALEVTLEQQDRPATFAAGPACKITLGGEACELDDLRPRDQVDITHDTSDGSNLSALSIAARRTPDPTRWALLIGVSGYDDSSLPKTPHAAEDIRILADVVSKRYAAPSNQVLSLTDPSLARLREAVPLLVDRVRQGNSLIVYFQGAAVRTPNGTIYLAPKECNRAQVAATGLSLQALVDKIETCPAKEKLLLLDTGYGPGEPSGEELFASLTAPPGQAALRTVTGIAGNSKSQQSQASADGKRGLFALQLSQGYAGRGDANRDNRLEPTELFAFLKDAMIAAGAKDRPQAPIIFLPDNRPPRLTEDAKKLIRAMANTLRQSEVKFSESRLQFDSAQAMAGKEPEPKLVFGLIALRVRNRTEAQRQFDELRGSHPSLFLPIQASAWLRFEQRQHAPAVVELAELAAKLPKPTLPDTKLPEITLQTLTWIGQLREFAPVADDRRAVSPESLEKLDAAVAALGPTATAAYEKGRQQSRTKVQEFDAQIEAAANDGERVRLRFARPQLGNYAAFPYEAVARFIVEGLDK